VFFSGVVHSVVRADVEPHPIVITLATSNHEIPTVLAVMFYMRTLMNTQTLLLFVASCTVCRCFYYNTLKQKPGEDAHEPETTHCEMLR
jgi:hypothetical protein